MGVRLSNTMDGERNTQKLLRVCLTEIHQQHRSIEISPTPQTSGPQRIRRHDVLRNGYSSSNYCSCVTVPPYKYVWDQSTLWIEIAVTSQSCFLRRPTNNIDRNITHSSAFGFTKGIHRHCCYNDDYSSVAVLLFVPYNNILRIYHIIWYHIYDSFFGMEKLSGSDAGLLCSCFWFSFRISFRTTCRNHRQE